MIALLVNITTMTNQLSKFPLQTREPWPQNRALEHG